MSFMEAVKTCFSKYATFAGRARRSEFWFFELFNIIVSVILSVLASLTESSILSGLSGIFSLAMVVPSIAVAVRRLHDIGKSGWFYLIGFIPAVGSIIMLVWDCKDSQPGPNIYGPNPKETY